MFWKKISNGYYEYLAVTRLTRACPDKEIYGQQIYALTLSDGTTVQHTFEPEEWAKWQDSLGRGGLVLNP